MAINKRQSGPWVKAVVVIVIVAFVLMFGFSFITSITGSNKSDQKTQTGTGTYETVAANYRNRVSANAATLQADPKNYNALVEQGNAYFDWANELSQKVSQNPQLSSTMSADLIALWISASDHYERALAVKPGDPAVTVDYAIATFYTGDTDKAIKVATGVTKTDPKFPQAWFNLGLFHERAGNSKEAINAFTKFVQLDPKDQQQQLQVANERLSALRSQPASETTGGK